MSFGLLNGLMLAGLLAVAIPPIIHLLTRKRFDVVEWGAMQFLQFSERTRRKVFIEELLLMAVRMLLIAVMVLALAAPYVNSELAAKVAGRAARDVVLVFDGSATMDFTVPGRASASEAAKEWAERFLDQMQPEDGVAIFQAKQQPVPVLELLSHDPRQVRLAIQKLPTPRGGADWPNAVRAAVKLLTTSTVPDKEIIILTDGQRHGWADEETQIRWELLGNQLNADRRTLPAIRVIDLDPGRPTEGSNWALAPIRASRAVASVGQQITFRTGLLLRGTSEVQPPAKVTIEVDGRPVGEINPRTLKLDKGQIPLSFRQRFVTAGSHLVSIAIGEDALPGDNRQDFALEVLPALPVLFVDGDTRSTVRVRSVDFMRDALAPARDPTPSVLAKTVTVDGFDPAMLTRDLGKDAHTAPRVLVLGNVGRFAPAQQEGIEKFLADGGGVLVAQGDRSEAVFYNDQFFRSGQGWLPARLLEPVGNETDTARAARLNTGSFFHPALDLFRETQIGGLGDARLPRYWKLSATESTPSTTVGLLTTTDPFVVEKAFQKGRCLQVCVPLDASWRSNLTDLPAFAPLVHELVFYLAGVRSLRNNLQAGQPLMYQPEDEEAPAAVTIQPPSGPAETVPVPAWPLTWSKTYEPGVYTLTTGAGKVVYYVVPLDSRESDLAPATDADRDRIRDLLPKRIDNTPVLSYAALGSTAETGAPGELEYWWLCMVGVIALLLSEVWMTRRMALQR